MEQHHNRRVNQLGTPTLCACTTHPCSDASLPLFTECRAFAAQLRRSELFLGSLRMSSTRRLPASPFSLGISQWPLLSSLKHKRKLRASLRTMLSPHIRGGDLRAVFWRERLTRGTVVPCGRHLGESLGGMFPSQPAHTGRFPALWRPRSSHLAPRLFGSRRALSVPAVRSIGHRNTGLSIVRNPKAFSFLRAFRFFQHDGDGFGADTDQNSEPSALIGFCARFCLMQVTPQAICDSSLAPPHVSHFGRSRINQKVNLRHSTHLFNSYSLSLAFPSLELIS